MTTYGKLLVVEDDITIRTLLSLRLESQGHSVNAASNGKEALELLKKQQYDLILLDIMMPIMNGFEVLETLKNNKAWQDLPVIVISALDELDSVVKCITMGAEDYLTKPVDPVLLKARIDASLDKKRMHDAISHQLDFIQDIFGKYVPQSIIEEMVARQGKLPPQRAEATLLYTDIEKFTSISEKLSPDQAFDMLNEYFPAIIQPITDYGGIVNHFQGDALLAMFNLPIENEQHADNAMKAALEIQKLNGQKFANVPLVTRIGINTGQVISGNVGSGNRYTYSVYGDAVNLSSRLEQMNKTLNSTVAVSEKTVNSLRSHYPFEYRGEINVRGKEQSVKIYTI